MGRPSKLTEAQKSEIKRRMLEGAKHSDLAKEFKVSRATISTCFSKPVENIKAVANQVVNAERSLAEMPVVDQLLTVSLASKLRAISDDVASAAMYGAKTAHRLNALANSEVAKIDDADPLDNVEALRGVAALTKLANDSASIALNLLSANKDAVKEANAPKDEAHPLLTDSQREMLRGHFNAAV